MTPPMPLTPVLRRALGAGLAVTAAVSLTGCGSSDVTRPRLEASLTPTFANLFVHQQTDIYGHPGVTTTSVAAQTNCDKGGLKVPDHGPGADWICTIKFTDETRTPQEGKFDVQAKSNSCYTAAGPSKLIGLVTITNHTGTDVPNPVFEFDGCFDPRA